MIDLPLAPVIDLLDRLLIEHGVVAAPLVGMVGAANTAEFLIGLVLERTGGAMTVTGNAFL